MHNLISATKFFHMVIILVMIFVDLSYWRLLKKLKPKLVLSLVLLSMLPMGFFLFFKEILPEFYFQVVSYETIALFLISFYMLGEKMLF